MQHKNIISSLTHFSRITMTECLCSTSTKIETSIRKLVEPSSFIDKLPADCIEKVISFCKDSLSVRNLSLTSRYYHDLLADVHVAVRWFASTEGNVFSELDRAVLMCLEKAALYRDELHPSSAARYNTRLLDALTTSSLKGYDIHRQGEIVLRRVCSSGDLFGAELLNKRYGASPHALVHCTCAYCNRASLGKGVPDDFDVLHGSITGGHFHVVYALVMDYGVKRNDILAVACFFNRVDIVRMLLFLLSSSQLNDAIKTILTKPGSCASLRVLFELSDIDADSVRISQNGSDEADVSTLSLAVRYSDMDTVDCLLERGADPYLSTFATHHATLLDITAAMGRLDVFMRLTSRFWSNGLYTSRHAAFVAASHNRAELIDAMITRFGNSVVDDLTIVGTVHAGHLSVLDTIIYHDKSAHEKIFKIAVATRNGHVVSHMIRRLKRYNDRIYEDTVMMMLSLLIKFDDDDIADNLDYLFLTHASPDHDEMWRFRLLTVALICSVSNDSLPSTLNSMKHLTEFKQRRRGRTAFVYYFYGMNTNVFHLESYVARLVREKGNRDIICALNIDYGLTYRHDGMYAGEVIIIKSLSVLFVFVFMVYLLYIHHSFPVL